MKTNFREKLYKIIEADQEEGYRNPSAIYDVFIIIMVVISLIPLASKEETQLHIIFDKIAMVVFIIDYLLRLFTADLKYHRRSWTSFVRYPFSVMAMIDLLSILPSLTIVRESMRMWKYFRLIRAARVVRVLKFARYSRSLQSIVEVFRRSREPLAAVGSLAVIYVLVSALIIFTVEPDTFENYFEAIYWSTISLTTVGYGDFYPVSQAGRVVTMLSSIFGIAIVALPSGIITAGYFNLLGEKTMKERHAEQLRRSFDEEIPAEAEHKRGRNEY